MAVDIGEDQDGLALSACVEREVFARVGLLPRHRAYLDGLALLPLQGSSSGRDIYDR
jgi:hypothetical protein